MAIVRAFPRLHFGLADLGRATPRAYGGAGVLLAGPHLEVEAVRAPESTVGGLDRLDERTHDEIVAVLARLQEETGQAQGFRVTLLTDVRQHVGLGTKTALLLAVLQAASIVAGLALKPEVLQRLSGRGGASGIGIHAFFQGGFLMDGGHPQEEVEVLFPSSARKPMGVPPLVGRLTIPESWRFRLLLAPGKRLAGSAERRFFATATPIPRQEVLETIATLAHGVAPAIASGKLSGLGKALIELHACGFKKRELEAQSSSVRGLLSRAAEVAPAGLSSLGPLVYVVTDSETANAALDGIADEFGATDLGSWSARQHGFEVIGH